MQLEGEKALLPPNLAPFQIPFGDWFFCALNGKEERRPTDGRTRTEPPDDTLALDCKHLRNLYPADEKEGREGEMGRQSAVVIVLRRRRRPTATQNPSQSAERNGTKELGER